MLKESPGQIIFTVFLSMFREVEKVRGVVLYHFCQSFKKLKGKGNTCGQRKAVTCYETFLLNVKGKGGLIRPDVIFTTNKIFFDDA